MIDAHQDVRWGLDGQLTLGDIIGLSTPGEREVGSLGVEDPPRQELVAGLTADRWIRLRQSGEPADAKIWLDDVAVDPPAVVEAGAGRRSWLSVTSSNGVMRYSHRNNQIEWVGPRRRR
jgi:hypothetical protein